MLVKLWVLLRAAQFIFHQGHRFPFSSQVLCEMTLTAGRMFDRGTVFPFGKLYILSPRDITGVAKDKLHPASSPLRCLVTIHQPMAEPLDSPALLSFPNGWSVSNVLDHRVRLRVAYETSCEHEVSILPLWTVIEYAQLRLPSSTAVVVCVRGPYRLDHPVLSPSGYIFTVFTLLVQLVFSGQ